MSNRFRPVRRLLAAAALATCALFALASSAQAERELDQRFFANQRGNITMAANSLTTCSTVVSNCLQRRDRTAPNLNNGAIQMQFNDVDGDPTTKSSAKAMLNLPAGAEVLFAGLYWGGRPELKPAGSEPSGSAFNVTPAEFGEVKLAVPGDAGYQPISASVVDEINFGDNGNTTWQGFADVTSLVSAAGPGEYMVGGVRVEAERITNDGTWGGWALVVAYSDPSQPWRNLVVYDGLKRQLSTGSPTNISLKGFRTPPAPAAVNSTMGIVAYEGDGTAIGDSANFVQDGVEVPLGDALNPTNNFFNSRISREGTDFGDRTPNYSNNYGFDGKLIKTTNALKNSTTEATLRLKTAGDGYATGAVTMATELFTPKVTLSKSVENVTDPGAPFAHPGDVLEYEITAQNQASTPAEPADAASSFVLGDAIPAGLNYVPGSLAVSAGPGSPATPTDTVGDDVGEYDAGADEVRFRVGTGANGTAGGTLASGETTTVRFQAEIDLSFPGGEIDNEAVADYKAATLDIPLQDRAKASLLSEQLADLTIEKTASPELVTTVPSQVTYTLAVENKGPGTSASTVVTDQLPAGLEYVSDDAGCDTSALPKIECNLGTMIAGASEAIQIVAEVPSSTTGAVVKNTAKVEGATPDLEPNDNEDSATVEVEPLSDLAITKTTPATSVKPGDQLTYFLTAENKGPTTELVTVTDTLPAGLAYVSDNGACDTSALPKISCEIGMQEKGKSNTVTLVTEVLATSGAIENTAKVSGALNPDPEPKNDESTATTPVEAVSDLALEKTVSAPSAKPGEQLT
ncbi:MAG: DUF11 domain-containing protein, partial [Actinomycetota bacterium]|nr:DUF11 domain-containing protein [Actinomycetota bacterium]